MKNKKEIYNIGLDIGTNSVGWAVTDSNNNILKYKNKNLWGSRLFEEGKTAAETRGFRGTRRRIERRKERINILQSLLLDDMEKNYSNFFQRLRETSKVAEEKNSEAIDKKKYNIFSEIGFTDATYYYKYPTIYHLRNALIKNEEKFDFRLVYLAIHHIIKYRGNFLYEGDLKNSNTEIIESISEVIDFIQNEMGVECLVDKNEIKSILMKNELSKGMKKDCLIKSFEYVSYNKTKINNIICAILGYKFDINKIFDIEMENSSISFSSDILNEEEIKINLNDKVEIYECLKKIYNWFVLQEILEGDLDLSDSYIKKYNRYKEDLELLKNMYRHYLKKEYTKMFRQEEKNSYAMYNKKVSKCSIEDLYKRIKNDLKNVENNEEKRKIIKRIEEEKFLIKLNTTENAAIPYQLHYQELEKILENQSKFYSTIKENKEKILALMKFRIPYYIGPLAKDGRSKYAWIVRKSDGKILPWTYENIVDIDQTAENFIRRMTNKCTYLLGEDVIPKQSILYSEFCVLNELANIRINNQRISSKVKKLIINELFKVKKIVRKKDLKQMLLDKQIYSKIESITGLSDEEKFLSNMASFVDMKEIFEKIDEENIDMIEKIIEWITIFEDKKILKRKIKVEYKLDDKIVSKILKKKYSGWSRLSRKLLIELRAYDDSKNIMEKLRNTKENFMQIINNDKYGFNIQIENILKDHKSNINYAAVDEIQTSPANKRTIWQCMKIVKEITKVMKNDPKNIYIEFAREESKKGRKNNTRAKKMLKIYEKCEEELKILKNYKPDVYKELKNSQNDIEFNEKLYLYFSQNGRCMYSSDPLNIDTLYLYEVDHILPQRYIKDDSLSNKVLVKKKENQRKSGSLLLSDEVINKQEAWWKQLHKSGLIDDKKYNNLTSRKMFETDNDKAKFIARQLVETRQITKYVTNLLVSQYENTEIFSIRSELTSEFRKKLRIYKNRNVNDYHHAQDAYIISVIGNIIDTKFQYKNEYKYTEYVKKFIKEEENDNKNWIIMKMILNNIDQNKIIKYFEYKDCYVTRKLEEQTGAFYNQTLYSPNDKGVKAVIPLKENRSVEKYGGYSGEQKAYFTICSYIDKKNKKQFELIGIPIKIAYDIKNNRNTLENYILNVLEEAYKIEIIKPKILKYQEYLNENNEIISLLSDREIRTSRQLVVNKEIGQLIYIMNKDKIDDDEKNKVEIKMTYMYNYLLEKMLKQYKIYESVYLKLNDKKYRGIFENETFENRKAILNGIIDIMHRGQGNLKKVNLGEREGRRAGKAFKTAALKNMVFLQKSVTGIYEERYTINGMENNSCK